MTRINADWKWARCLVFQHSNAEEVGKWFWSIYGGLGHWWEGEYKWLPPRKQFLHGGRSFYLNFWIWHSWWVPPAVRGEKHRSFVETECIASFILYGTCMKLSHGRGYDCSTSLLGPKYQNIILHWLDYVKVG